VNYSAVHKRINGEIREVARGEDEGKLSGRGSRAELLAQMTGSLKQEGEQEQTD
jgi:hypothetical protein